MAKTTIHRLLSRRDIPLRERALWRMLYETAARAAEILALNVEDLDLEHRRAPVRSKGGAIEWVYWDTGTAHLPLFATTAEVCQGLVTAVEHDEQKALAWQR